MKPRARVPVLTILADIQILQVNETGDGWRNAHNIVVTDVQLADAMAVKQLLQEQMKLESLGGHAKHMDYITE